MKFWPTVMKIGDELKFPVSIEVPKGRWAFAMFKVGDHEWSVYKDYEEPGTIDVWWTFGGDEFEDDTHDMGIRLPDVWKKTNGSWNIVYGKRCY